MHVTGLGFVPEGSHNSYDTGAWITPAGYDRDPVVRWELGRREVGLPGPGRR